MKGVDLDVEAGGLVKRQTIVYNGVEVIDDEGKDIEHASWLSKLFLMWTTSMVAAGYRKPQLESEDLFQIRSYDRPEPNAVLFWNALERYKDEDGTFISYAIWRAIFRVAWKELLKAFLLELLMNALRFTTPVLLGLLVTALEDGNANSAYGYGLAFGLLLGQLLSTLAQSTGRMISISIGLRLKNALTKMTFEHILRLDQKGKQGLSNGKVVNLVSTDAQAALDLLNVWNRLVTAPIVLIAGVAFIYSKVGPSVLFGVLLMALFVPVTLKFAKIQTTLQRDKMKQTDIRVKLVNEMMQGVKILKLNSWEKPLVGLLDDVRKEEMKSISRLHYYRGITSPFAIAMPNIASVVTFIAYIRLGNEITPAEAFSVVSAFVIIRGPFSVIPMAISMLSKALVSGKRFTDFFALSTERANQGAIEGVTSGKFPESRTTASVVSEKPAEGDESSVEYDEEENDVAISMRNSSFTWTLNVAEGTKTEKEAFRLEDLNFEIKKGELVAVVGNIASGKSSLISSLIGDMEALSGKITCRGNLALCTQEPFIMNRTVRENILFEAPFEAARYNAVLEACALVSDLAILPASDLTEIGERGVNVSGGQKSRISLARAVYANPDVVLLDDPLSAVDAHVGKHIFEHCISNEPGSVLAGKTRVFVTNQLHLLDRMDRIILMADGRIVDQGTYAEIMSRDSSLIRDLQQKHAMQEEEEEEEEDKFFGKGGIFDLEESDFEDEGEKVSKALEYNDQVRDLLVEFPDLQRFRRPGCFDFTLRSHAADSLSHALKEACFELFRVGLPEAHQFAAKRAMKGDDCRVVVAHDVETLDVVGAVVLRFVLKEDTPVLCVENIVTDPDRARGKGLGGHFSKLVDKLAGFHHMSRIEVSCPLASEARSFFEHCGFEVTSGDDNCEALRKVVRNATRANRLEHEKSEE
mmetsp:Transcript_7849/g.13854  ORF Transcript_7849/g.13854 Transcript_7849/m.13854 type:complete len:924 (+) Transcript_7849:171-2942(+)